MGTASPIFFLIIFVACTSQTQAEEIDILAALEAEGILATFDPENIQVVEFSLTQAALGDLVQTWEIPVEINFPRTHLIGFDVETIGSSDAWITSLAWQHGRFSGVQWEVGDMISEGDFIAELYYFPTETLLIDRREIALERQQFETNFSQERITRLQEIEDMRHDLQIVPDDEWELLALRLERAELSYRQFEINADERREYFDERLEYINEPTQNERLYALSSGRVMFVTDHTQPGLLRNVPNLVFGSFVIGRRIISIVDGDYIHFTATPPMRFGETVPSRYALRYGDIVPVSAIGVQSVQNMLGVQLSFDAIVATDPLTTTPIGSELRLVPACEDEFAVFMAEIEEIYNQGFGTSVINFLQDLNLRAQPVVPLALNAVIVDSRAVTEENNRHFVMLYEDGRVGKRYVTVGAHLDIRMQIISGLEPGQWVVMP